VSNERVMFKLFQMPCCGQALCWVNPRLPNYCPECGKFVFATLRTDGTSVLLRDNEAVLKVKDGK
jgi:hypothetical protein